MHKELTYDKSNFRSLHLEQQCMSFRRVHQFARRKFTRKCQFLHELFVLSRGASLPLPRQARDIDSMLGQCWASVYDAGPTLVQHWVDVSCLPRRADEAASLQPCQLARFTWAAPESFPIFLHGQFQVNFAMADPQPTAINLELLSRQILSPSLPEGVRGGGVLPSRPFPLTLYVLWT